MQTYNVKLESEPSTSFRAQRAANSLDIDTKKKSSHSFSVTADIETPFNIGLIVGASGSGKTTLAESIYGKFQNYLDLSKPIIDQFPEEMSYDDCVAILNSIGLSSVPCWIRPASTLSNGQRARAEAALACVDRKRDCVVVDEWTSVVDRTVAKAMSFSLAKHARNFKKKFVLLSCHYDVIEWLQPDWIIDCNSQRYIDRRSLREERQDKLQFDIREITGSSWRYFSKYHYLSDNLPGGKNYYYGLFHGDNQIGFQCFANYIPTRPGKQIIYHSNRTVIHPDYVGFGLGMKLINSTSQVMFKKGYRVMAKFSSTPVYKSMSKSPLWRLRDISRPIGNSIKKGGLARNHAIRIDLKIYSFEFTGG